MYLICNVLFHNFITLIILVYLVKMVFGESILEMSRNLGIDFYDVSKLCYCSWISGWYFKDEFYGKYIKRLLKEVRLYIIPIGRRISVKKTKWIEVSY